MLKASEQKDNLKCAIILSIMLHLIFILVLIYSSIHQMTEPSAHLNKSSIDTVILNPNAMMQQDNNQRQQRSPDKSAKQQPAATERQRLTVLNSERDVDALLDNLIDNKNVPPKAQSAVPQK